MPLGTIGLVKLDKANQQRGGVQNLFAQVKRYHSPKKMVLNACDRTGKPLPHLELPKRYNVNEFKIGKL